MKYFKICIILLSVFLIPSFSNAETWYGKWMLESSSNAGGIDLSIQKKDASHFSFEMELYSGANTRFIEGDAVINGQKAVFVSSEKSKESQEFCRLEFTLQTSKLVITENGESCATTYGGAGAYDFTGDFIRPKKKKEITLKDFIKKNADDSYIFENEQEWKTFSKLVGKNISFFNECAQNIVTDESKNPKARVSSFGVDGLYTEMEGIILIGPGQKIWAAVIDTEKGTVKYFTNVSKSKKKLPKAVDQWRERFKNRKIEFVTP